jgi:hypothetical protein
MVSIFYCLNTEIASELLPAFRENRIVNEKGG